MRSIFVPWDWSIATNFYMDDVQRAFNFDLGLWFAITIVLGGIATLIMAIVFRGVRTSLGGELEAALALAQRIAAGDLVEEIR
jgi:methyl-accepting chemotaxis protein